MKRIAPWLLPTLLGPLVGATAYVWALSMGSNVPRFAWVLAWLVACGFAWAVGGLMAVTDFALLKLKLRTLPTGWRAWVMGTLAPMPVFFSWQKLLKYAVTGWVPLLLTFFLPMLVTALVLRVALGTRPKTWE